MVGGLVRVYQTKALTLTCRPSIRYRRISPERSTICFVWDSRGFMMGLGRGQDSAK